MKRNLTALVALLCAAFVISACATPVATTETTTDSTSAASAAADASAGEKIQVITWHTLTDHHLASYQQIIDNFNASQDTYEVVAQQQTYGEYDAKLMQAVSAGNPPDVVSMFPSEAINFIEDGFLYDMAPFINDPETGVANFESDMVAGVYDSIAQWGEGSIYIYPGTMPGEVLFYNKTMLDELGLSVPTTWTEVESVSKAIYEAYGVPGFGTDSAIDTWQSLIMQAGSDYIDVENKSIAIDRTIGIEKLEWFANGVKEGYFRLVGEDFYFSNPFGSQAVGMYIGSSAGVDYVYAAIPAEGEEGHFEVGAAPIPQEGPVGYIGNWSGGNVILSKDEEHARGAYEFIKFFNSVPTSVEWAIAFGSVPVFSDARNDPAFQEYAESNIAIKALSEELPLAGFLPSIYGSDTVRTEIDKMIQSAALGVTDAETAYDEFVTAANAALQQ